MLLRWLIANYYRQSAQRMVEGTVEAAVRLWTGEQQPAVPPEHFRYAVVVAVRLEVSVLLKRLAPTASSRFPDAVEHWGIANHVPLRVVEVGTRPVQVGRSVERMVARRRPQWVCAAGFAAALTEDVQPGSVVSPERIVDDAGQVLPWTPADWPLPSASPPQSGTLVSLEQVLTTSSDRQQVAQRYQANYADQETAAIVRVCLAHDIPCSVVRVVSDAWNDTLPQEVRRWLRQKSWAATLGAITGSLLYRRDNLRELWQWQKRADECARQLADVFAPPPTAQSGA